MSLSSHEEEEQQRSEPSMQSEQAEDILDLPMIVLSSSSSELSPEPVPKPANEEDPYEETVIQNKRESEYEKQKRINSVKNMWIEQEQKEKRELNDIRNNPPRRQKSQANKAKESQLHKEFPGHTYLPMESLEFVKERLQAFASHPKCKFECKIDNHHNNNELQVKMRQNNRLALTRVIILARQELKTNQMKRSQLEEKLCKDSIDILAYAYQRATEIEMNFYKKLFNKRMNRLGEAYSKQIKLVLREFGDRNNIAFRRKILSKEYDLKELVQATEESLMCEKTKQEREERLKQLIRQNEKIEPKESNSIDEEIVEVPPSIKGFDSIKSRSDFYDEKVDIAEDKTKRQKDNHIGKNKQICKKTYNEMAKYMRMMKQRVEKLKTLGINKNILQKLKFDLNINL